MLYNDLSPMENHHSAAAFSILLDKECNFLSGKSRLVRKRVGGSSWSDGEGEQSGGEVNEEKAVHKCCCMCVHLLSRL